MRRPVPLIETAALSEFGDLTEQAAFHDPDRMGRDVSYVPGFSEMRRDVALQVAAAKRGEIDAKTIKPLPVNLRWGRCQDVRGNPNDVKLFGHSRHGYKPVTKDMIGKEWLTAAPPGSQVQADGTIRNGDTMLLWCPREDAARNEFAKRKQTEERTKGAEGTFASMVQQARSVSPGAKPTTTKLPTEKSA